MEVILLENIRKLGNLGDTVSVKPGYGRNYLIPQKKAVSASKANIAKFEERRAELETKAKEKLQAAQDRADKLKGLKLTVSAMASEEGKLYGSVGTAEIVNAIAEAGHQIEKKEVVLSEGAIHELGDYEIGLQLHSDLNVVIYVEVVAAK